MTCEVSVVIPCLNEARTVATCVRKALAAMGAAGISGEVVVADNGSSDESVRLATDAGARVIAVADKGYGAAVQAGIVQAHGTYVIMGDADDSYDFGQIPRFIDVLRTGVDLVMGCRFPSGGGTIQPGAMPWKHRYIGNPVLSWLGRLLFRTTVSDFHCGIRGFRRESILQLGLQTTGMEYASEMIIRARLQQFSIAEVPVTLSPDGRGGRPSHLRSWRDGWRHLRFLLLCSPMWLYFIPGGILYSLGICFFLLLLAGPLFVRHIGFDTNTLLVTAAATLIGFQIMSFAIIAKAYAYAQGFLLQDRIIRKFLRHFRLEWGLLSGAACFLGGVALLVWGTWQWKQQGFGPLSYSRSLRIVIPAVVLLLHGSGIFFASFLISMVSVPFQGQPLQRHTGGRQ